MVVYGGGFSSLVFLYHDRGSADGIEIVNSYVVTYGGLDVPFLLHFSSTFISSIGALV